MNAPAPDTAQRRIDIAAAIGYGICGVAILSLQPLAFGPLVEAGRLSESNLGAIAGLETAGLALSSAVLPGWISGKNIRPKLALLAVVVLVCNLLTPHVGYSTGLWLTRLLCGLAEGGVLAGAFVVLFHSGKPDRMNALFLAVSNIVIALISYLVPTVILPQFGTSGPFSVLAGLALAALIAVFAIGHKPEPMPAPVSTWRSWPFATWLVLVGIVLQNAGVVSGWVFLESTARAADLGAQPLALSASLGLLAQVAGASTVALIGYRLPAGKALVIGGTALAGAILWLGHPSSALTFILPNVVMGAFWLALLPLSIKLVCEIERNHHALYLTAAAQLLGMSLGPLISSLFVSSETVKPAYWVGFTLAMLAVGAFALAANSADRIRRTA
ncbi:hypothetical protein [Aurantiacibacter rhizosphaerae]|uniref:hypothetical protein n=1 Tax=Aurantiacibacter rhizosphaerae TaxID=2691582 RepID=UPI00301BE29B